jgi:hypothetical protein
VLPTSANFENGPASDRELNPLSNQLLAANLGRWAEIYFTNPPERRAQAVASLLRELQIEAAENPEVSDPQVSDDEEAAPKVPSKLAHSPLQAAESLAAARGIVCTACGHLNLEGQSFCGMCGVRLTPTSDENRQESAQPARVAEEQNIHGIFGPYYADYPGRSHASWDAAAEERDSVSISVASNTEDSDLPSFARQQPVPYRYRLYLGVVLAILLGGLIYLGKRGDIFSDRQQSPDSKIIPAAQPTPITPAAQNTAGNSPLPAERVAASENPQQPKPEAEAQPTATAPHAQTPLPSAPQSTLVSAKTPAASMQRPMPEGQSGGENLAEAQRYLNGTQGHMRDAREAVPLLWDAVAKGNAPATLVLSDLYLRGDGVPQNCDQARLLLDMAAKKGVKGATERLLHLQAFGCR